MGVRRTPYGWEGWATGTVDGRGVRRHVRGRTRAEVSDAVRVAESALRANTGAEVLPGGDRVAVSEWLASWISGRTASVRPETPVGYRLDKRHIDAAIGGVQVGRLTPEHVEKLYAAMAERGLSAGTVLHVRRTLSAAMTTAVARGQIGRNVVRLAAVPRDEPPEIEPLTPEEAHAIAKVAGERRNGLRWLVALVLGLRQGEVLGLKWSGVDWTAATVSVRRALQRRRWRHGCSGVSPCGRRPQAGPLATGGGLVVAPTKTRSSRRTLALPAPLMAALTEHRRAQAEEQAVAGELWVADDWIFATEVGAPIDPRHDLREWVGIVAAAGIRRVRIHGLRYASSTLQLIAFTDSRTPRGSVGPAQFSPPAMHPLLSKRNMVPRNASTIVLDLIHDRRDDGSAPAATSIMQGRFGLPTVITACAVRAAGPRLEATGRSPQHFDIVFDDIDDDLARPVGCEQSNVVDACPGA